MVTQRFGDTNTTSRKTLVVKTEVRTEQGETITCSVLVLNREEMEELAEELNKLQAVENEGRGISHIRTICTYLRRGEWDLAVNVYRTEGDKTGMYPVIKKFLRERMGCRTHGVKDCPGWFCS